MGRHRSWPSRYGWWFLMVGAFRLTPATGGVVAAAAFIMANALVVMAQAFNLCTMPIEIHRPTIRRCGCRLAFRY